MVGYLYECSLGDANAFSAASKFSLGVGNMKKHQSRIEILVSRSSLSIVFPDFLIENRYIDA
jgi:hypothetical protein